MPLIRPELTEPAPQINEMQINQGNSFANTFNEFVTDVNSFQKESEIMTEKLIKGEAVDLHDVMIAAEKAKTSFQLLLELRNKVLDLYREVNRLQV
jgi:flagellar hook-basal body complex protein FliE